VYQGSTFIQGWSTWIALLLCVVFFVCLSALGDTAGDILTLATWIGLAAAVYQDLDRTRMSRWWLFWAFFAGFLGFGVYLYTRNSRGLRTGAAD
jgi:hypothetical protein